MEPHSIAPSVAASVTAGAKNICFRGLPIGASKHRHLHSYLYYKRSDQSMATVHIYRNRQGMKAPPPPPIHGFIERSFGRLSPSAYVLYLVTLRHFLGQGKCRHEMT